MKTRGKIILLVVACVALGLIATFVPDRASSTNGTTPGPAPPRKDDRKTGGPGATVDVTRGTFSDEVLRAKEVVVVDFWSETSERCKQIAPFLRELAGEYAGRVKVCKVDIMQEVSLSSRYNITTLPCLIMFKNGREIGRKITAFKKSYYKAWFEKHAPKG